MLPKILLQGRLAKLLYACIFSTFNFNTYEFRHSGDRIEQSLFEVAYKTSRPRDTNFVRYLFGKLRLLIHPSYRPLQILSQNARKKNAFFSQLLVALDINLS